MSNCTAARWALGALIALGGCSSPSTYKPPVPITAENHTWFPIAAGTAHELGRTVLQSDGPIACEGCHNEPDAGTFAQFSCLGCHMHEQSINDRLHLSEKLYSYASERPSDGGVLLGCLSCHPAGAKVPYDHAGIDDKCAACHDVETPFAALPKAGFTHPSRGAADCGACHVKTTWLDAGMAPDNASNPAHDIVVNSLLPTWAGTSIIRVTPLTQTLSMPMSHGTTAIPSAFLSACENCHPTASTGDYFPGNLHSSLANLKLAQPAVCSDCHATTLPTGFVGPLATSPARTPPTGEMRHEAVLWDGGAPGTASAVPFDCSVCHSSPSDTLVATWTTGRDGGNDPGFHASLRAAGKPAVSSCLDCHANSRATGVVTVPPLNILFDHRAPSAQGDCGACHAASAATNTSWAGGIFHAVGSATPSTCLPCHDAERPTTTTGWTNPNFRRSPFDYLPNSLGITHGNAQDCAVCHNNPGTGAWGNNPNWAAGSFSHAATTVAATTCIGCHTTQRPDLQPGTDAGTVAALIGFDHAANGTGDCFGCHQATVTANTYLNFNNPATNALPGGDWKGGQLYPGSVLVSSATQFIKVNETTLNRTGALVTSTSTINATLYNAMLHTSPVLPAALNAGPTASPDYAKCWHCHTHTNGTVTAYSNGKYHSALTAYAATPGGAVVPFPQPTANCTSCHSQMRPVGIVEKAASTLQPMDHSATFTAAAMIGGVSVTSVSQVECAVCHNSPGNTWTDGQFHPNLGAAVPADCNVCHYPLMADAPKADVTTGTTFSMRHRSPLITFQTCQTCHAAALAKGANTPIAATLWRTGAYHPSLATQPTACVDCHAISDPLPNASTRSSVVYTLALGGTATNGPQWMNHGSSFVVGKDCAVCHQADAKTTGSAWNKGSLFHTAVTNPTTCRECHGTTNGGGTVIGTNNNLPLGLTNSTYVSSAGVAGTGVPAGTLDQLNHAELNVASRDCGACHTQKGVAGGAIAGKEWKQAKFHPNFSAATPLINNGTTARCSTCHLNVKPTAVFTAHSHSAYTAASGTTDCSSCHSFPGTGTTAAANWKGATGGVPAFIPVGGFTIPAPPATTPTTQTGIANLPHPTVGTQLCTACHATNAGGKQAFGYDHKSTLINANCKACHETGSNLIGTPWNGATTQAAGAGDTRPFTLTSVTPTYKGNTITVTYAKHFYPVNCYQCHVVPAGNGLVQTGAAYLTAWRFVHTESKMTNPSTCIMCHKVPK